MADYIKKENVSTLVEDVKKHGVKPTPLFGSYIYKGEIAVLYGDTNTGKSILANDVCLSLVGGKSFFASSVEHTVPTMYFDFEMTRDQYGLRYQGVSDYLKGELTRVNIDALECSSKEVLNAIEREVIKTQDQSSAVKFLVIDNITYALDSLQSGKEIKKMMQSFKQLKDRFGLTILLIAHCTKRKPGAPIREDDLGGSKMLLNFVDSAFAIGSSVLGNGIKYIKQIKTRMGAKQDQVQTIEICGSPYLHFEPREMTNEIDHLKAKMDWDPRCSIKPEMEPTILRMRDDGATIQEIADRLDVSKSALGRYCKKYGI